jgi:hypothetical protein
VAKSLGTGVSGCPPPPPADLITRHHAQRTQLQNLDGTSVERFSNALAEFDRMIRIDAWKTKILLVAKRRMESMIEGGGGDGDGDDDDELL